MEINQIQSQLQINRRLLAGLHMYVDVAKDHRKFFSESDCSDEAYAWHSVVVKYSKKISKLVSIQKALKKDLSRALYYERTARQMNLIKVSCMANVGEMF